MFKACIGGIIRASKFEIFLLTDELHSPGEPLGAGTSTVGPLFTLLLTNTVLESD